MRIIFFFEIFLNSIFLFISGVFVSQIDAIDDTGTAPTRVCEISIHNYKHTVFKNASSLNTIVYPKCLIVSK